MAFFRRELGPVERFENALKEKLAARQKLANQSSLTEKELAEKRAATERLAVAGAASPKLDRAEASMRAVDDRARTLRAALVELDEGVRIVSNLRHVDPDAIENGMPVEVFYEAFNSITDGEELVLHQFRPAP